ncbi:hypothetical protein L484_013932 [Morus notabilis]|uniref:Uncharacterized protein n=1 Tax=Morus notabilis TaxID=981085 RepID=W9R563_9ROSA|nr:hypothetical protein L484_013932 [Morus notabilis]
MGFLNLPLLDKKDAHLIVESKRRDPTVRKSAGKMGNDWTARICSTERWCDLSTDMILEIRDVIVPLPEKPIPDEL